MNNSSKFEYMENKKLDDYLDEESEEEKRFKRLRRLGVVNEYGEPYNS